jgi:hypothetical protein
VSDFRFYVRHVYACPICLRPLVWKRRPESIDSLMLIHELHVTCSNSGKKFYAPVQQLTEIPVCEGFPAGSERGAVRNVKQDA